MVGTAQEGQTLTASDSDTSATFQWQSLVNGTWTSISGATGSTYKVAEGDENNVLRVEATGTAGQVADSARRSRDRLEHCGRSSRGLASAGLCRS